MKPYNFVYLTTNLLNNKQYVGSHAAEKIDDEYLGSGRYFLKAIKKYGKKNFKREILQECVTILEARELEEYFIKEYNTMYPLGYNLAIKGGLGFNGASLSDHTKDKIKIANTGKIRTPEMKENISKGSKRLSGENHQMFGKTLYDVWKEKYTPDEVERKVSQWKEKLSEREKGDKHHYFGKHRSEETKQKISNSLEGKSLEDTHKENLKNASLNIEKVTCKHCGVLFTPWGLKNHQLALKRKNI